MEKLFAAILFGLFLIIVITGCEKLPDLNNGVPRSNGTNLSNYTDLIVQNLTVYVNSFEQKITVITYIQNLGNGIATDSTTQVRLGNTGTEERLPTPFIGPGQIVRLNNLEFSVPGGTSTTVTATADYLNNVIESNEFNNVEVRRVIMP